MLSSTKFYNHDHFDMQIDYTGDTIHLQLLAKDGQQFHEQTLTRREFFQFYVHVSQFADELNDAILAAKPKH